MATESFAGPVDFLVFAFPEGADVGTGLELVLQKSAQGDINILDIELLAVDAEGAPLKRALSDLQSATSFDLSVFDGVDSGIVDADDRATVAADLSAGQVAIVVIYEDRSLAAAAEAWAAVGGVELLAGGVDIDELERVLGEGNLS